MKRTSVFLVSANLSAPWRCRHIALFMIIGTAVMACRISWAQTATLANTPDVELLNQQQMQQNKQEQEHRIQLLQQPPLSSQELEKTDKESSEEPDNRLSESEQGVDSEKKLPFKRLQLELSDHLSKRTQAQLRSYIPIHYLTPEALQEIQQRVAQAYVKQGYFRLKLQQRKQGADLVWSATPAKVHAVRNNTRISSNTLLPGAVGKAANIKDLDQALDQANRLPNRKVTIDVYPDEQGDIAVSLSEKSGKSWRGVAGVDYQSNRSISDRQVSAQLVGGNMLGIGDAVSLYVLSSLPVKRDRYLRAAFINYSVPYGYWTFTANTGTTAYRTWAQLSRLKAPQSGKSHSFGLRAERVVSRGSHHITSVHGQLNRKSVDNRLLEQTIEVQSSKLTTVALGMQHTRLLTNGSVNVRAEAYKGLTVLGAQRYKKGSGLPNPQFIKFSGAVDWVHFYPMGKSKRKRLRMVHQIAGQYGAHSLPNAEQFSAGDRYSVRGTDAPLSGDSGSWVRNTAYLDLDTKGKLSVHPYIGLDAGYVNWKEQGGKRQAISATAGLLTQHPDWDLNVSVSRARARGVDIKDAQTDTQWHGELRWLF